MIPAKQAAAASSLLAQDVDVITQHQDCTATITKAAEEAGGHVVGYHADASELAPKGWVTGRSGTGAPLYNDIVDTALAGEFTGSKFNANFRVGYKNGTNPFVSRKYGPMVDGETKARSRAAEKYLRPKPARRSPARSRPRTGKRRCSRPVTCRLRRDRGDGHVFVQGVVGEHRRRADDDDRSSRHDSRMPGRTTDGSSLALAAGALRRASRRSRRSASPRRVDRVAASRRSSRATCGRVVWVRHGAIARPRPRGAAQRSRVAAGSAHRQPDLVVDIAGMGRLLRLPARRRSSARRDATGRPRRVRQRVTVDSTVRRCNDRGYECLWCSTTAAAPIDPDLVGARAHSSLTMSGGIFGALGTCCRGLPVVRLPLHSHVRKVSIMTATLDFGTVDADPYAWPYDGDHRPRAHSADLHRLAGRLLRAGGYVDTMGYDLNLTRAGLEPTQRCSRQRATPDWLVIHTREGHRPDLADCPPNKLWRSKNIGAGIGDAGRAGGSWCAASPAGRSSPRSRRSRAS